MNKYSYTLNARFSCGVTGLLDTSITRYPMTPNTSVDPIKQTLYRRLSTMEEKKTTQSPTP